jgi:hypothetical protein
MYHCGVRVKFLVLSFKQLSVSWDNLLVLNHNVKYINAGSKRITVVMTTDEVLVGRKTRLEKQLKDRGISDYEIKYLPYLDFDESTFATAYEVGVRMIILTCVCCV